MYKRVPDCMIAALEQFFTFTFHDAQLFSLRVDSANRTATLDVSCLQSQCDGSGEVLLEEYRRGCLVLQGVEYVCFDPGDAADMQLFDSPETISEFLAEDPGGPPCLPAGRRPPADVTAYRLYFFSWNCFLHLGVRKATFTWTEPPRYTSWHILEIITRLRTRVADNALLGPGIDPTWRG